MKYSTWILVCLILTGASVQAGLLPGPEGSGDKLLPGGGSTPSRILPDSSTSGRVLPTPGNTGTKVLPAPAKSTGGGDFFIAPTNIRLTRLQGSDVGNNSAATLETGEPQHGNYAGNPGGKSLWWRYESRINGTLYVSTAGSKFDTVMGVYVGDSVSTLVELASDDNSGPGQTSLASVRVTSGTIYYIAIDGYNGTSGDIALSVVGVPLAEVPDSTPVNDNYEDRILMAGSYAVDFGTNFGGTTENTDFNPVIDLLSTVQDVWWTWTAALRGKVTIKTAGSDFDTLLFVYRRDADGNLLSTRIHDDVSRTDRSSLITIDVFPGDIIDIAVDGFGETLGFITLSVEQTPASTTLVNDSFDYRVGIQGASYNVTSTTTNAFITDTDEPLHDSASNSGSVWWTWTAPANGVLTLRAGAIPASGTIPASALKPLVALYSGKTIVSLKPVISASDVNSDGNTQVSASVKKGTVYQIAIARSVGSLPGGFNFSLSFDKGAPIISNQPLSAIINVGEDAVFQVKVASTAIKPLTFRWQRKSGKSWVNISNTSTFAGATTATLTVNNASASLDGVQFRCIVSNASGSVTSSVATLKVIAPAKAQVTKSSRVISTPTKTGGLLGP